MPNNFQKHREKQNINLEKRAFLHKIGFQQNIKAFINMEFLHIAYQGDTDKASPLRLVFRRYTLILYH